MRYPRPRIPLLTVLSLALVLSLLHVAPAGAERGGSGAETAAAARRTAEVPSFLGVAGIDLARLGYRGPNIDAFDLGIVDRPLPAGFIPRGRALGERLDVLGPQRRGLAVIVPMLDAAAKAVKPRLARQRRRIDLAGQRAVVARDRLVELRESVVQRQEQLEAHRERVAEAIVDLYVNPPYAGPSSIGPVGSVVDEVTDGSDALAAPVLQQAKLDHDFEVEDRLEVGLATLRARERAQMVEVADRTAAHARARSWLEHLKYQRGVLAKARDRARHRRRAVEARVQWIHNELDALAHVLFGMRPGSPGWAKQLANVPLREVGGIRVHVAVSHRLESLLAAARADGIVLRGWGYRSHQRQIELRHEHCGPTHEDVWAKPSSACSPPTALPGRSLHEVGLAVDFTHDGAGITSRHSAAYRWLARHAPMYGFANLPSEPWHWSLTGG